MSFIKLTDKDGKEFEVHTSFLNQSQPTGVAVWVCRNKHKKYRAVRGRLHTDKPTTHKTSRSEIEYSGLNGTTGSVEEGMLDMLDMLGVKEGQCKKFIITEVVE